MTVLMVVVSEEQFAKHPGVLDRTEVRRERRAVLEGFERGLAVRVEAPIDVKQSLGVVSLTEARGKPRGQQNASNNE